jgi:glyoxylase-like metal-dependent hydrolase (beta-lactamase superfamily II)
MNRKTFLKTTAATLLATSVEGLQAKGFAAATPPSEGLQVRFLGTGAADWKGRDERGEHRRLSSILLDDSIFIDLTATNLEMIPAEAHPETIFYTHSHGDHYHPASALRAGVKRVYLGQTWYDIAKADFQRAATQTEVPMPEIIPLYVGQKVNVPKE